jgi:hypothetical protein
MGKAARGLRSPTGTAAKKLVLLSIVAARAAFGSLAAVATPPRWSRAPRSRAVTAISSTSALVRFADSGPTLPKVGEGPTTKVGLMEVSG